jgi:hypothetical protein
MSETEVPGPGPSARRGICPNDGKPFDIPAHVRGYKRFCSDKCRSEWHSRLRKKALEMMREKDSS